MQAAPAPGAIDLYAWTERGVYRPGETVHAAALARDISAKSIDNLPLTFIFLRPDGVEDRRIVTEGGKAGGYTVDLPILTNAMARYLDDEHLCRSEGRLHRLADLHCR